MLSCTRSTGWERRETSKGTMGRQQGYYDLYPGSMFAARAPDTTEGTAAEHPPPQDQVDDLLLRDSEFTPPEGHKAYRVLSKQTLEQRWLSVPYKRKTTVLHLKQEASSLFDAPIDSQELTYGGMPLVDSWCVMDLPPDVEDLNLWVRRKVPDRLLKKRGPTLVDDASDFIVHSSQITEEEDGDEEEDEELETTGLEVFEKELCDEHNRQMERNNLDWEMSKACHTLDSLEEELHIVTRGNIMIQDLTVENKRLRDIAEHTTTKMEEFLNPLKHGKALYSEFKKSKLRVETEATDEDKETRRVRNMLENRDAKKMAKAYVSDLQHYLFFVFIFSLSCLGARFGNTEAYYFGEILKEKLETRDYFNVVDTPSMWRYVETDLMSTLFVTREYTGAPVPEYQRGSVLQQNRLVGGVRFRQIRGSTQPCANVPKGLGPYISTCYTNSEEEGQFTCGGRIYTWKSASELDGAPYSKGITTWGGGGYIQDLPASNATQALAIVQQLKYDEWVDKQTRAFFVDFSMYNTNLNKFTICRLFFEMPLSGGVVPLTQYDVLQLFRYSKPLDFVVLLAEIVLTILQLLFVRTQIKKVSKFGFWRVASDVWVVVDWINIIVLFVVLGLRIHWVLMVGNVDWSVAAQDQYINLVPIAEAVVTENYWNAVNAFLMYVRAFRFLNIFPTMASFRNTLGAALSMNMFIWMLLLLVMVAYSTAGFVAFGQTVKGFKSPTYAMLTLFEYSAGEYNFKDMERADPFLGPLITITYMIAVFLVLMNLFYSILADAYAIEMTVEKSSTKLMLAIRAECFKTFEPILPFLKTLRLREAAEQERQHRIQEGELATDQNIGLFTYRLKLLIENIGMKCAVHLFKDFIDVEEHLNSMRHSIEVDNLDVMQFLAGAALEDNQRFEQEILEKFNLSSEGVYEKFQELDEDGSNCLDTIEMTGLLRNIGIPLDLDAEQEVKFFSFIDIDGNGEIDFDEFMTFYENPRAFIEWFKEAEGVGQRVKAWAGRGNPKGLTKEELIIEADRAAFGPDGKITREADDSKLDL